MRMCVYASSDKLLLLDTSAFFPKIKGSQAAAPYVKFPANVHYSDCVS